MLTDITTVLEPFFLELFTPHHPKVSDGVFNIFFSVVTAMNTTRRTEVDRYVRTCTSTEEITPFVLQIVLAHRLIGQPVPHGGPLLLQLFHLFVVFVMKLVDDISHNLVG